jgi:hypothetical protein
MRTPSSGSNAAGPPVATHPSTLGDHIEFQLYMPVRRKDGRVSHRFGEIEETVILARNVEVFEHMDK